MTGARLRLLPVVAAVLLLGCGDAVTTGSDRVAGRTFLLVSATGLDVPAAAAPRLSFTEGDVRFSGGCNSGFGTYELIDGLLDVTGVGMTEMACDQPLMALDDAMVAFLTAGPTVELADTQLVLSAGDVVLTFADREVVDPDRPLVGTTWTVTTLIDHDAASSVAGTAMLLVQGDRAAVRPGCNTGSASVRIVERAAGEGTIEFGPMALTRMACAPDAMALESFVVAVLSGTVDYAVEAGSLTLSNGDIGLVLTAADQG